MEEYCDNRGCVVLVEFHHKQVTIDSFKHCELTDSEDLLNHGLKDRESANLHYQSTSLVKQAKIGQSCYITLLSKGDMILLNLLRV